jgi:hypothetical protein
MDLYDAVTMALEALEEKMGNSSDDGVHLELQRAYEKLEQLQRSLAE